MCVQDWPSKSARKAYVIGALFLGCYALPLVVICFCYVLIGIKVWTRDSPGDTNSSSHLIHKSRVKVVKMIAVVVIIFASSWLPLYVVNLYLTFEDETGSSQLQENVVNPIVIPVAQWLGSSNSGMNPIIYCFFSRKFREGFKDAAMCFRYRGTTPRTLMYTRPCLNSKYTLNAYPVYKMSSAECVTIGCESKSENSYV